MKLFHKPPTDADLPVMPPPVKRKGRFIGVAIGGALIIAALIGIAVFIAV